MSVNVLFVCTGNICRSPMAQAVFQAMVDQNELRQKFRIDSCGTTGAHIGQPADHRVFEVLKDRGYKPPDRLARQVQMKTDFLLNQYIIACDRGHKAFLKRVANPLHHQKIHCLLQSEDGQDADIPDPFYGTIHDFNKAYALIAQSCEKWFEKIIAEGNL